jgi:periplasmic protein CpxP/Spy
VLLNHSGLFQSKPEIIFKTFIMYRIGLFAVAVMLILSTGCGRFGNNNNQNSQQQPSGNSGGPGRGGFGGGMGRFTPEDQAKRLIDGLAEYVKLTDEQKTKITEVSIAYSKKNAEVFSGRSFRDMSDEERQEMRGKMEAIQADREKEIKALLTEEQLGQYGEYQKAMEQRRQEMMQRRQQQN